MWDMVAKQKGFYKFALAANNNTSNALVTSTFWHFWIAIEPSSELCDLSSRDFTLRSP